jgi:hypothetical protein
MPWGREVRQELSHVEEDVLRDAVCDRYCACFSTHRKGMVMRSVRHDLKKMPSPVGRREVHYLVLLTRARFYPDRKPLR